MAIPGDPGEREWIELSGVNQHWVDQFRPTLISFVASGSDMQPYPVGSGFLIGAGPQMAIALTAKHVLTPGVLNVQRPHKMHAKSALAEFLPKSATTPSIHPKNLFALWADSSKGLPLQISFSCYNESTDLAVCVLTLPPNAETPFLTPCIPIHTGVPNVGEIVHMVSYDKLAQQTLKPITTSEPGAFELHRTVSIRRGYVTGVYLDGYRQYRWPCITSSIPAEPGMSGGFVFVPKDGETIAACGVVSADNSATEARGSLLHAGESVIGLTYMALGLTVPVETSDSSPQRTIQQMMRDGDITPPIGGFEQFRFIVD